jgi:hypothetical protein
MSNAQQSLASGPSVANLLQRHELFKIMHNSHLRWMGETDDLNIKEMHRVLADLFQTVMDKYEVLLNALGTNVEYGEKKEVRLLP